MLKADVNSYIKGCNVYLASKLIRQKSYSNLQSLSIPIHQWKGQFINFVIRLFISNNQKDETYGSILIIVNQLIKMLYYKSVKMTIYSPIPAEVIINVIVCYHSLLDSIIFYPESVFISKIWSLHCYFLGIKRKLFTTFHPQTNCQTKRQNKTMEGYLRAFVNFK